MFSRIVNGRYGDHCGGETEMRELFEWFGDKTAAYFIFV